MARRHQPWFRFYVEACSDRKLRRRTPAQRWLWVAILAAARQSPIPGFLVVSKREPMDDSDIADFAGMTVREVRVALPLFEASQMIDWDHNLSCWRVINFATRQYESDDVTARTRKHRAKERDGNVPTNEDGTFQGTTELDDRNAPEQSRAEAEQESSSRSLTTPNVVARLVAAEDDLNEPPEPRRRTGTGLYRDVVRKRDRPAS